MSQSVCLDVCLDVRTLLLYKGTSTNETTCINSKFLLLHHLRTNTTIIEFLLAGWSQNQDTISFRAQQRGMAMNNTYMSSSLRLLLCSHGSRNSCSSLFFWTFRWGFLCFVSWRCRGCRGWGRRIVWVDFISGIELQQETFPQFNQLPGSQYV